MATLGAGKRKRIAGVLAAAAAVAPAWGGSGADKTETAPPPPCVAATASPAIESTVHLGVTTIDSPLSHSEIVQAVGTVRAALQRLAQEDFAGVSNLVEGTGRSVSMSRTDDVEAEFLAARQRDPNVVKKLERVARGTMLLSPGPGANLFGVAISDPHTPGRGFDNTVYFMLARTNNCFELDPLSHKEGDETGSFPTESGFALSGGGRFLDYEHLSSRIQVGGSDVFNTAGLKSESNGGRYQITTNEFGTRKVSPIPPDAHIGLKPQSLISSRRPVGK